MSQKSAFYRTTRLQSAVSEDLAVGRPRNKLRRVSILSASATADLDLIFLLQFHFAVSDEEMQRLRIAFKRCSGVTGFVSQQIFAREVLGDGVPTKIAEVY